MGHEKKLLSRIFVSMFLAMAFMLVYAQYASSREGGGTTITATGCLAKGDSPGEFHLISDDGKRYQLRSDTVSLADHVGHKVTVKGSSVEGSQAEDKDKKSEGSESYAATLQVTSLQMVSSSCK